VKNRDSRPLNAQFDFALSLDHPPGGGGQIFTNSHGRVIKKVGEFMANEVNRTLAFGSPLKVADWDTDIVNPQNDLKKVDDLEVTIAGRLSGTATPSHLSGEQNVPLGIADIEARASNLKLAPDDFHLIGGAMDEDEQLAELFFNGITDYRIKGTVTATPASARLSSSIASTVLTASSAAPP